MVNRPEKPADSTQQHTYIQSCFARLDYLKQAAFAIAGISARYFLPWRCFSSGSSTSSTALSCALYDVRITQILSQWHHY